MQVLSLMKIKLVGLLLYKFSAFQTNLYRIYPEKEQIKSNGDRNRVKSRARYVWNWLENYAPEDFKFKLQNEVNIHLSENEISALKLLGIRLKENEYNESTLFEEFYNISKQSGLEYRIFFSAVYRLLINKEKGPKLAPFILQIGKERVIKLLEKL